MVHHLQHIVDLVAILRLKGIEQLVVSPGSRNAPLIKLFSSDSFFRLHSIVDERAAAFYGLGIALATQKPVALICTSGTAVLNYSPALAEAFYQHVPLIAITADRPENLIDQQDNQTIRQVNVYSNYTKESIHLHQPLKDVFDLQIQHFAINKIINSAVTGLRGPVHINVPIPEPLYVEMPVCSDNIILTPPVNIEPDPLESLVSLWESSRKRMVLCGQLPRNSQLHQLMKQLADEGHAIVLAEPISNISGNRVLAEIDRVMMKVETYDHSELVPDLLISLGGPVVSKRLKAWLQKQQQLVHFRLTDDEDQIDTYNNLQGTLIGNPVFSLGAVIQNEIKSDYQFIENWEKVQHEVLQLHTRFLKEAPFSDLKVFDIIMNKIPVGAVLHLGNSSPVRYGQLFDTRICNGVYANRGVSGIDGCISTAAGFASQNDRINLLLLGDLSFVYDSNGLWNRYLSANFKIVVINNGGGGIFRLLPGPQSIDGFEEYIETRHQVSIEKLTEAFGLKYFNSDKAETLEVVFDQLLEWKASPAVLEIVTPKHENAAVYAAYIKTIKAAI